ncbi:MAG: hypothetical protein R3C08_13015 [Hyphomonas sp.]
MKTAEELQTRHTRATEELSKVEGQIAEAIADGRDARSLQNRRDHIATKIKDLLPAIRIARQREADAEQSAAASEAEQLRRAAVEATEKLHAAAKEVDRKIAELGTAYDSYRLELMDADKAVRAVGSDLGRVVRGSTHGLRWALSKGAHTLFADSGAARVQANREAPFADTVKRCLPNI